MIPLAAMLTFGSCDDFLGEKPKSQIVLKNTDDYERLLDYYVMTKSVTYYVSFLTDDVFLPDADPEGLSLPAVSAAIQRFYTFAEELYPTGTKDQDWIDCYRYLYTHNTIIDGVLGSEKGSDKEKKQIYAEALLGRAFLYHQLLTLYAKPYNASTAKEDPGVPLILVPDVTQTNLTRASIQSVYDKMIEDLTVAIPLLSEYPRNSAFRGSKAAAEALLARYYLYQGKYEQARDLAESALKTKADLIDLNKYSVTNPTAANGRSDVPYYQYNPECVFIRMTTAVSTMSKRAYVDLDLLALFDKNTDRRYKLFITDTFQGKKRIHDLWAQGLDANLGISTPEIYLTAAECHARLGNITSAMERLNQLRKNRYENYAPITAATSKEAVKLVLDERRRELMMIPCIRLADLKRLAFDPDFSQSIKRTINGVTTVIPPTSNKLVLQIPEEVMVFNPDMVQNSRED